MCSGQRANTVDTITNEGARRCMRRAPPVERANKPSSVPLRGRIIHLGPSSPTTSVRPTRDSNGAGRPSSPTWPCSGWGLPCGPCYQEARCALTAPFHPCLCRKRPSAVYSLWHFPSPHDARVLPGILPCGARTFLHRPKPTAIPTRPLALRVTDTNPSKPAESDRTQPQLMKSRASEGEIAGIGEARKSPVFRDHPCTPHSRHPPRSPYPPPP